MYPLLHADLGRRIAGRSFAPELGRLAFAFAAITALTLFLDTASPAERLAYAATDIEISAQERN